MEPRVLVNKVTFSEFHHQRPKFRLAGTVPIYSDVYLLARIVSSPASSREAFGQP